MENEARLLLSTARFEVRELVTQTADGETSRRAVVRHPGAVAIVPLLTGDRVCLIRNRRVTVDKTLIEIPAGTREPNETPLETAARELIEETGFRADRWTPLREFFLSPGILDERMHLFVAESLEEVGAQREPGEEIENWIVSWEEALHLVHSGQIEDAKTIVGLLCCEQWRHGG